MARVAKKESEIVEITADMIKAVRKATGADTLDCKDFLKAAGGDVSKAIALVYREGKIGPSRISV